MNTVTVLTIAISIMGVLIIPTLVLAFRAAIRWKGIEDKLGQVVEELKQITEDKNKVHAELNAQMREDRNATNQRLRWLEENLWKKGDANAIQGRSRGRQLQGSE